MRTWIIAVVASLLLAVASLAGVVYWVDPPAAVYAWLHWLPVLVDQALMLEESWPALASWLSVLSLQYLGVVAVVLLLKPRRPIEMPHSERAFEVAVSQFHAQ